MRMVYAIILSEMGQVLKFSLGSWRPSIASEGASQEHIQGEKEQVYEIFPLDHDDLGVCLALSLRFLNRGSYFFLRVHVVPEEAGTVFVENEFSDMHFLRIRQSRSFSLSTGFLLSELDLSF